MWQRFSGHHRRHRQVGQSGELKAGALYHLTENGNVYINYAVSQQPPGGNNFALAQSGSGNSANRTDFKPQKANTSEIGTKWQVLDKRLLLTAALFRTDIENEVEQNDDGTYRNTVRNASKAMRYPWQGISLPRGR